MVEVGALVDDFGLPPLVPNRRGDPGQALGLPAKTREPRLRPWTAGSGRPADPDDPVSVGRILRRGHARSASREDGDPVATGGERGRDPEAPRVVMLGRRQDQNGSLGNDRRGAVLAPGHSAPAAARSA